MIVYKAYNYYKGTTMSLQVFFANSYIQEYLCYIMIKEKSICGVTG